MNRKYAQNNFMQ